MTRSTKSLFLIVISFALITQVTAQKRNEQEKMNMLFNKGVEAYNARNYTSALENFDNMLEISDMYYVDSVAIYYSGLASKRAKKYEEATLHFNRCIAIGYMEEKSFVHLAQIQKTTEDNAAYVEMLKTGLESFPESVVILGHIVDYYIEAKQLNKASTYIDRLIPLTPDNAKLYYTKAAIFTEEGNVQESNKYYQKAIDLNPRYFDAYFSMGANYFNKGVEHYELADTVKAVEAQTEEVENYISSFKYAMTYMEKAYTLKPDNELLLSALKDIYSLMQEEDDVYKTCYEEITRKLNGEENNFLPSDSILLN